jgi:hypothetical protein
MRNPSEAVVAVRAMHMVLSHLVELVQEAEMAER